MKLTATAVFILISFIADAQDKEPGLIRYPGIYVGAGWTRNSKVDIVPQAWFYVGKKLYVETRYNYEDEKTVSVHFGLPVDFAKEKGEIIPTAGLAFGNFRGYVLGLNGNYDGPRVSWFAENEYCFSSRDPNFFFSWAGIIVPLTGNIRIGGSWQYTLEPFYSVFDTGPMVELKSHKFKLQLFGYNTWKDSRYWQVGISYDWGED